VSERAFLGSDLALDADSNDLVVVSGDLGIVEGDVCLQENLIDRLHTSPGGVIWNPTFGAGLLEKLGEVMSDEELQDFAVLAKFELEADPRVDRVVECQAFRGGEPTGGSEVDPAAPEPSTGVGLAADERTVYLRWVVETAKGQVEGNMVFPFPFGERIG